MDMNEFDSVVQNLSTEATEALEQITDTVADAETATDEITDVAGPVVEALSDLSAGDRAGAAQAFFSLFDNETSKEIEEARAAVMAAVVSANASADEIDDVVDIVAEQASQLADSIDAGSLRDRLAGLF